MRSKIFLCIFLLLFIGNSINTLAQTFFFDNYKTIDGIESSKIYSICQTKDGFIWFGTDVGISRFDGSRFDNYSIEHGLASGGVRYIFEDSNKTLWIGHEGGNITQYSNNHFSIFKFVNINSNITSFCQDSTGNIWITTFKNGAFRLPLNYDDKGTDFNHFSSKELSDVVFNSFISHDGTVYLITDIGIQYYCDSSKSFNRYSPSNLDTYFQFSTIFEDSRGFRWYGTYNGGLYKQDVKSGKIAYFDIKSGLATNWITDIIEDRKGNIWIAHWDKEDKGGLTRIKPDGSTKVFNTGNGMHDNKIWCVIEDIEGNIIAGTTANGIDIFKGETFISYTKENGIVNNQIYAICQDVNNNIWLGTNEGITVLDSFGSVVNNFNQQNNQISNLIRFIVPDKNSNLWIGTEDQGVQMFDTKRGCFVSMPQVNQRFHWVSQAVLALDVDNKNTLWLGITAGLINYDINTYNYVKTYGQIDGLPSNEIESVYYSSEGILWVGTKNGLSFFKDGKFEAFKYEENVIVTAITENSKNQIIVGTKAHGVLIIENYKVIKQLSINDGLLSNNIRSIIVDDYDNIYAGTTIGLNKILSTNYVIVSFSKRDGFVGIENNSNAVFKDNEGKLWFGTVSGVIKYDPLSDNNKPALPIVHISEMYVNGELVDMSDDLVFLHNYNNISFKFSSISITHPNSDKYLIMLEGADKEWNESVNRLKSANYSALQPGDYTFKIKAINSHGLSNEKPAFVSFTILAPFYKRPFFITMAIVIVLITIGILMKIRERNLIREKTILAKKVDERTRELSQANNQLAERNKDITDSIHYARRIQFAILPADIPFKDTFIFFQPKDIVSGDFYWANTYNGNEFLAVVDCTGHGVPGAFMSFIGHTSLNKIIIENGISKPSEILMRLNIEVTENLHQKEDDAINDGMDIALICYNPKNGILEYAGAYNPLWIVRNGELLEVKGNRFSIGRSYDNKKLFTNHIIQLEKNDMVYMFTDGYIDQFGGSDGKKFKSSGLRQLLLKNAHLSVDEQHLVIYKNLLNWKDNLEQVDDILIIGRRFTDI
ncbi:MAG: SpoIIE family protein phosphatase [Marinilabiliaceae bacterium]|nr:SpoIIE family protein phosphatase [Marinilabiliaceae bacterium]